jgi:hypothetical protein
MKTERSALKALGVAELAPLFRSGRPHSQAQPSSSGLKWIQQEARGEKGPKRPNKSKMFN